MKEEMLPPRLYMGPRQEKQYRKNQRQLHLKELQIVASPGQQETNHRALVPIEAFHKAPMEIQRISVPKSNRTLVCLAVSLGAVGIGINAWYAWSKGSTLPDKVLLSSLGFLAEAIMFFLLSQAKNLWQQKQWGSLIGACLLWPVLFVFALTNSLGFASLNLAEASTVKAERITPAVADAQRRLDTLSASRRDECLKRGDRCRQLEKDEQTAIESLREAREKVSVLADPQIASAAKLVAWVSVDRYHPSPDDFAMLRLLLLTLLPQLGGLVLMVASRRET
jgi:hypothetical protein